MFVRSRENTDYETNGSGLMGSNRDYYIDQYKQLHKTQKYGTSSGRQLLAPVQNLINKITPQSVLDYGCGQSDLYKLIRGVPHIVRYDPAIAGIDTLPEGEFDLVLSTDVMEHIPEDTVDEVLEDLHRLGKTVYIVISCIEAYAKLPNGENAHTTIKPQEWWENKLKEHWNNRNVNLKRAGYISAVVKDV